MIFRYSTLADAYECLQKYYRKHVAKDVEDRSSLDLEFGTSIHLAIKEHYEGGNALQMFEQYWDSTHPNLKGSRFDWGELREMGTKFTNRFINKYSGQFKPIHLEKTIELPMEGHTYRGTLDMLCEYEGKVTLIDWKTSAGPYKIDKIYTSEQLYGYAALAEAEFGIKIEQIMYFVFVKSTGNIQTNIKILLEREKLDSMVGNIRMMIRDLSTRKEFPKNPNCRNCVCGQYRGGKYD